MLIKVNIIQLLMTFSPSIIDKIKVNLLTYFDNASVISIFDSSCAPTKVSTYSKIITCVSATRIMKANYEKQDN